METEEPGNEPEPTNGWALQSGDTGPVPSVPGIWQEAIIAVSAADAAVAAAQEAEAAQAAQARQQIPVAQADLDSYLEWTTIEEDPIPDWAAATTSDLVEAATVHSEPETELESNLGGSLSSQSQSPGACRPGCTCATVPKEEAVAKANAALRRIYALATGGEEFDRRHFQFNDGFDREFGPHRRKRVELTVRSADRLSLFI